VFNADIEVDHRDFAVSAAVAAGSQPAEGKPGWHVHDGSTP